MTLSRRDLLSASALLLAGPGAALRADPGVAAASTKPPAARAATKSPAGYRAGSEPEK